MFKTLFIALTATCLIAPGAQAQDYNQIKSEDQFRALVVGKKLYFGDDHFTVRANGSLTGRFGGKRLKGAWEWRDQFWCRTLTAPRANTDCQTWATNGSDFRATRSRGSGRAFVYTLR